MVATPWFTYEYAPTCFASTEVTRPVTRPIVVSASYSEGHSPCFSPICRGTESTGPSGLTCFSVTSKLVEVKPPRLPSGHSVCFRPMVETPWFTYEYAPTCFGSTDFEV